MSSGRRLGQGKADAVALTPGMSSELEIKIRLAQQQAIREGQELANKLGGILRGVKGDVSLKANDADIRKAQAALKSLQTQAQQTEAQAQKIKAALNLNDADVRKVTAEMKRLEDASGRAGKELSIIPGFLQSFAGNLAANAVQQLTQSLLGLGSAAVQSVQQAIGAFGEFDQAKQAAATLTNNVGDLVSRLKESQQALGGQVSTTDLLKSSYDILSSGFTDSADAAEIATQSARGAIAGFSDSATVADALTTILNSYNLTAKDSAGVIDQLVKTQDLGKITVDEYAQGIGRAASIASIAGVSFEELNAVIAASTAAGVPAESAISGVRQAIVNLQKPTADSEKLLKKFQIINKEAGISSSAAALQAGGLSGVLNQLAEKGATSEDLAKIFSDVDGLATIAPIAGENIFKLNDALAGIGNATGAADKNIGILTGSLSSVGARLEVLRNEIDVAFGEALAPVFGGFEDLVSDVVKELDGVSLAPLTDSAKRLGLLLSENPKLVQALAAGIEKLANESIQQFANILDAISSLATNEEAVEGIGEAIGDVAGAIGLLGRFAQGVIGIFEVLFSTLEDNPIATGDLSDKIGLVSPQLAQAVEGFERLGGVLQSVALFAADLLEKLGAFPGAVAAIRGAVGPEKIQGANASTSNRTKLLTALGGIPAALEKNRPAPKPQQQEAAPPPAPSGPDLKELTKVQDNALSALDAQATQREAILKQQGASEEALAKAEQEALQKRITAQQQFVAKLKASGLSGVEFDKELLDAQKGIAEDQIKLAEAKAEAIEEAEKRALEARENSRDQAIAEIDLEQTTASRDLIASGAGQEEIAAAEQRFLQQRLAALREFANEQRAAGVSPQEQIQADKAVADAELNLARQVAAEREKIDRERLDKLKAEQAKAFEREQQGEQDAFDEEAKNRQKAFQKELQADQRAFNKQTEADQETFAKRQQADAKAFQAQQQAAAEAFAKRQQAERDKSQREFGVLTSEVDRRVQLANAPRAERADLQAQFAEEDRQNQLRRDTEAQVLRERGSILNQRGDELEASPLEQAQAEFEERLQAQAKEFQAGQQVEQEAFAEEQRLQQKAFQEELELLNLAYQEEIEARQEAFADIERGKQRTFQEEQRAATEAFNEQQRQLDKASAREIQAILAATPVAGAAIPARRLGGPVEAGQLYQVGESGPELFRSGAGLSLLGADGPELFRAGAHGQILSAEQTASMLTPSSIADLNIPISGGTPTHRLESQVGRLVAALSQQQPGGDNITFYNEQDPYGALEKLQAAKLRNLVRGRG